MKLTTQSLIKQLVSPTNLEEHTQARINMFSKAFAHLESLTKKDARMFYIQELEYTEEEATFIIDDIRQVTQLYNIDTAKSHNRYTVRQIKEKFRHWS